MYYFIYDKNGKAFAHIQKGVFYSIKGKPLAFINGTNVYSYSGKQLGTFKDGWVRDLQGYCVLYSQNRSGGGPIPPIPHIPPIPSIPQIAPISTIPAIPKIPAIPQLSWSKISAEQFFNQR